MTADIERLSAVVAGLRRTYPTHDSYLHGTEGGALVNPDGPEAADAIEALIARIEEVVSESWHDMSALPEQHRQVLVRLRDSVGGTVCDVACYTGKDEEGEDRWILADIGLTNRQITHWAYFRAPAEIEADRNTHALLTPNQRGDNG